MKNGAAVYLEFQDFLRKSYPPFVRDRRARKIEGYLPVFSFHTIEPDDFEAKLQFLEANKYITVTADEALSFIAEGKKLPPRSIMLTFDDGRKSAWAIAYPLLKKYRFKATVFMVPAMVRGDGTLSPNLDDLRQGRARKDELNGCDKGPSPTISWVEALEMHKTGVIDFQSHSFDHRRIPVGPRIIGFVNPAHLRTYYFSCGIPLMRGMDSALPPDHSLLGAPIYENAPFFKEKRMYQEDVTLREKCLEYVREKGGEDFFKKRSWRKELFRLVRDYQKKNIHLAMFETDEGQEKRIRLNLKKAKEAIEEHLPGKEVRHLAYPWGAGSNLSVEMSKKEGYASNYWLTIPGHSMNRPGGDPYHIVRLKHDFLWRLPGEGRKPLKDIFLLKFTRRIQGKVDY